MTGRSYLSEFEQLVLLSVLRLGDDAHGGEIRRQLDEVANRPVAVATVYVALARLEQRGLVRSWMSEPTPVRGGKAKKFYALEPQGIDTLGEARSVWERMWSGLGSALDSRRT